MVTHSQRNRPSSQGPRRANRAGTDWAPTIERLEDRVLLAGDEPVTDVDPIELCLPGGPSFELVGSTLNIVGTAGNDAVIAQVTANGQLVISVNQVNYSIPSFLVTHIHINVQCGDDSVTLRPSVLQTSGIEGGSGNDSVSVGG